MLQKLSQKELRTPISIIERIAGDDIADLDVKNLQGQDEVYRAREGNFPSIFSRKEQGNIIIAMERRPE